eukprot:Nk52_evm2s341 gene=Nk52_evmTU2s341
MSPQEIYDTQKRIQRVFSEPVKTKVVVDNVYLVGINRSSQSLISNELRNLFLVKTFDELLHEIRFISFRLGRLGVFKGIEVVLDTSDSCDENGVNVNIYVEEKRLVQARTGTNVGNNEADCYTSFHLNNLFGQADTISANFTMGTRTKSSFQFEVTKPFLGDNDSNVKLQLYKNIQDFSELSGFRETGRGVNIQYNLLQGSKGSHTLVYDFSWRDNSGLPGNVPFAIRSHAGHSVKSSVKYSFKWDARDDSILANRGSCFRSQTELAGANGFLGGDVNFLKQQFEVQFNKTFLEQATVSAGFSAGCVKSLSPWRPSFDSGAVPINDRFFIGGPMTIRGFTMRGVGPHMRGYSAGGDVFWTAGLHLYLPFPLQSVREKVGDALRCHLFVNAGNSVSVKENTLTSIGQSLNNLFKFSANGLADAGRLSVGFGLVLRTGFARLELNYCIPLIYGAGDQAKKGFQMGVGVDFL